MADEPDDLNKPTLEVPGREGYIQSAAEKHTAHLDIRYIIEYQATDGDMVISRLTMRLLATDRSYLA
jgi:hypothetical protein